MAGISKALSAEADRGFPVRIRIRVPPDGLATLLDRIKEWLDENHGASRWAITPSGTRGVLYEAFSIYFGEAALASAFLARWCAGYKVETAGGVFWVRDDEPQPVGAKLDRTSRVFMIDTCPPRPDRASSWNEAKPDLERLPLDPRVAQGHLIHIAEPNGIFRSLSNAVGAAILSDLG